MLATDVMSSELIDKCVAHVEDMGTGGTNVPEMNPIMIEGEEHYVLVMSPFQRHDLRAFSGGTGWLDVQKAAATALGRSSPIFTGALGLYNGVVLHSHKHVIRFADYGLADPVSPASTGVEGHRALFLGEQALMYASGSPGGVGLTFNWYETSVDRGNRPIVDTGTICGVKKTVFNNIDFGVMTVDTAAQKP